ncbi:MAG TPA: hypothetical protein VGF86_11385 [Candidatus Tumulicola sp.]|jgi:hypothetical protein
MSSQALPTVRAAFTDLIDYAGLFPPARLATSDALAEYAAARAGSAAWMLGRFIVPASRAAEAVGQQSSAGFGRLEASVIADVPLDPYRWFEAIRVRLTEIAALRADDELTVGSIEVALPPLASARETFAAPIAQLGALIDRAGLRDLPIYVEIPPEASVRGLLGEALAALNRARLRAKLRCGGLTAEAFPSVAAVAEFVEAAVHEGVAFKATAGLHHPVRHLDAATGFRQHGFLNLLAAAAFARRPRSGALAEIVAEEDARAFSFTDASFGWRGERVSLDEIAAARAAVFTGYGSCSFAEPVEDLTALGLLAASAPAAT